MEVRLQVPEIGREDRAARGATAPVLERHRAGGVPVRIERRSDAAASAVVSGVGAFARHVGRAPHASVQRIRGAGRAFVPLTATFGRFTECTRLLPKCAATMT